MLRLFLSHPTIAADVAANAERGCLWSDEIVWFASGGKIFPRVFSTGGGFSILYVTPSAEERRQAY